jgi:DNA-binding SARP family transcriptional activator
VEFLMEFRVLGPVEFWAAGKQRDLGSAKERCMLAVLLLARGKPVPVETLIERVWGDTSPSEVRQSLHTDISRLRRRLRINESPNEAVIRAKSHTYALEVDPETVDVFRFQALRDQATSILQSGDPREAATLLRRAEGLWRSTPLSGLSGSWVEQTRAALDSDYRALALELADIEIGLGRHSEIISFLLDMIGRYPLDEAFVERLMLAYYRCGRQADALNLYVRTTQLLRAEAGADPNPELQDLQRRILRHDPAIRFTRPSPDTRVPDTLPAPIEEFTGRTAEVAALSAAAGAAAGVITIAGMPGVGKTALAVRVAHELAGRYPDVRLFLPLHAHDPQRLPTTSAAALSALLRAVGVPPGRIPRDRADRARLWRTELAGRRALIVLDDAAEASQILPLLPDNPDCQVIVTSRRNLGGLPDASRHPLGVLPVADAVALFGRVAGPDVRLPAKLAREVVELCGRLPLAIRMAAIRLREGRVSSIAAMIEELRDTHEDIAGLRDEALTAVFALSYRDLPQTQRRVFRRLGLIPASELTAPAVAVLGDVPVAEAERCLRDLVDHYLVEVIAPGRHRLHDLIRQYALACAIKEDPEPVRRRAVGRALDHYLANADRADRLLHPYAVRAAAARTTGTAAFDGEKHAREWMAAEWRNLFHLVEYAAEHEWSAHAIDLADAVARTFDAEGHWEEAETIHRRALKVALNLDLPRAIAQARLHLATIQWRMGRTRKALSNARKAQGISHMAHDQRHEAAALDRIGLILWSLSNYRMALAYFAEALDLYGALSDRHGEAGCLMHLGMALAHTGRYPEALVKYQHALGIYDSLGDARGQANTLNNIADTER